MDESSTRHIREVRPETGKEERYNTKYECNGVSNLFMSHWQANVRVCTKNKTTPNLFHVRTTKNMQRNLLS